MMQLVTDMLTTRSVSAAIFTEVHDALGSEATVALLTVINRPYDEHTAWAYRQITHAA